MKVLCFDVESNGLHGEAFAVAGVLLDSQTHISSQFVARCPITGPVDAWVQENVLAPMESIAVTATDAKTMRTDFWNWYLEVKDQADIIVAANPYPVEARFLIACQEDDLLNREFDHPFPYLDLSSMLYSLGYTTPAKRHEFVQSAVGTAAGDPHNPLWDATATAMAAYQAVAQLN
jgi:hypothetical protein